MRTRLTHAYFGLIAGFVTGLLPALFVLSGGLSAWPLFLYVLGGFMLSEAIIGFLLPKRAVDFFIDLFAGMFEGTNI